MSISNIDSIVALFSSEKFQDALNAIEELIVDNPNDALLFNIRGACYRFIRHLSTKTIGAKGEIRTPTGCPTGT